MKQNRYQTRLTHGEAGTRLYNIWSTMKQRVTNKNTIVADYYINKGIGMCDDWQQYEAFRDWALSNGYSDNLTLDRIDGNGDYCSKNCRWVDWYVQQNNRCNNHLITWDGITLTLSQWARKVGLKPKTLSRRIVDKGWSIEKALTTPLMTNYIR